MGTISYGYIKEAKETISEILKDQPVYDVYGRQEGTLPPNIDSIRLAITMLVDRVQYLEQELEKLKEKNDF